MSVVRLCDGAERRIQNLSDINKMGFFLSVDWDHIRERPAAIPVTVKSIDDTDNFDEFPDVELKFSKFSSTILALSLGRNLRNLLLRMMKL